MGEEEVGWMGAWVRGKKEGWMNVKVCNFSEERGRIACGWEQYQLSKPRACNSIVFIQSHNNERVMSAHWSKVGTIP